MMKRIGTIMNGEMSNSSLLKYISAEGIVLAAGFAFSLGVAWTTLADDVSDNARRQANTETSVEDMKESVAELSDQMIEFNVEQRYIREDIEEIKEINRSILEAITNSE